jgi:KDPG and KHG aldolase
VSSVRVRSPEDALFAVEAIAQGGIPIAEITLTVPDAIKLISQLRKENPYMVVGAGGVMDELTAQQSVAGEKLRARVLTLPQPITPITALTMWTRPQTKWNRDFLKQQAVANGVPL